MGNLQKYRVVSATVLLNMLSFFSNGQGSIPVFVTNQTSGCSPLSVQFTNASLGATSYYWDFGNGNISVLTNPSNVYSSPGKYTVKLITTSGIGTKDSIVMKDIITVLPNSIADFSTIDQNVSIGGIVSFVNKSLNSTTFVWDFGDGTTSALQNPTHSYSSLGTYTIKLVAYNGGGCTSIKTMPGFIHVIPKMPIAFTANKTNACYLDETFDFTSTAPFANKWLWNFGDGTSSTLQNPQHKYNNPGTYSISLTTISNAGAVDSIVKNNYISVSADPNPSFTSSTTNGCALIPISYTTTSDNFKNWLWNFGDGQTSTLQNPTHAYKDAGNYDVSLTVTNANNCSYTVEKKKIIGIQSNAISNFTLLNQTGCAPLNVQFNNVSLNDTSRVWDFGDGTTSTLKNPSHTYTEDNMYSVTLRSLNVSGCISEYTFPNAVIISPPVANFNGNMPTGCIPVKVTFNNSSAYASQWKWDFGDGETSTLASPVHTYNSAGDYTVSLIALNAAGCADTLTLKSYIQINTAVSNYMAPPTITGCAPVNASFEKQTPTATSWLWNFGDGSTSTASNPSHEFVKSGTYTVSLTIQLSNGCTEVYPNFETFDVQGGPAEFTYTQTACAPFIVNFKDTINPNALSYFWDFGDGATASVQNPDHMYSKEGFYTVIHDVKTASGCVSKLIQSNLLHFKKCQPQLAIDNVNSTPFTGPSGAGITDTTKVPELLYSSTPIKGCTPLLVNFHSVMLEATTWFWDFGDGTTSVLENPIHTYLKDGDHDVTMIGKNNAGLNDTIVFKDYIHAVGVKPNFSFTQSGSCSNNTLAFIDSTQGVKAWEWNFDDGTKDTLQNPSHSYTVLGKNYNIKLTATNAEGCTGSLSKNFLNVVDNATIQASKYVICNNELVNFMCYSANAISFLWDFGDGTTSTLKNPGHTYLKDGVYKVSAKLTDKNGCVRMLDLPNPITSQNPTANFVASSEGGCNSMTINVLNSSRGTSLPLASYSRWDFGDGSAPQFVENAKHTYTKPGTYSINLFVNNDEKCINIIAKPVVVYPAIVADFLSIQKTACLPVTVTYKDSSTTAVSWLWDFGDGTTSTLQNPEHTFITKPSSDVMLTITDAKGCTASKSKANITVFDTDFSMSATNGCAPLKIDFTSKSTSASEWFWDFGDGTFSTLQNPTHTYLNNGTFSARLICKTGIGCADTMINSIYVNKPIANFISKNPTNCSPTVVLFTDQSDNAVTWMWDFGDGSSSTNQNPSHIYNIPGLYTIKLIVTNQTGCVDTMIRINYIKVPGTIANFGISQNKYCAESAIQFIDSSVNASSWNWNFGDGNTSKLQNPYNVYRHSGQYSISLIVKDSFGCTSNFTLRNPMNINSSPHSNFTVTDTAFCSPYALPFQNNSKNANAYQWDFGDGGTSTLQNPTHIYRSYGTYRATLIAINQSGCSDTSSFGPIISKVKPEAGFIANETGGCAKMVVSFTDSSNFTSDASVFWNLGNGKTSTEQNPQGIYTDEGRYTVTLIVTNNTGCADTIVKPLLLSVTDRIPPAKTNILCATVVSDTSTHLVWEPSLVSDFSYYEIFRKDIVTGQYISIGKIDSSKIVSFSDTGLNTLINSYCYKIQTFDKCGYAISLDDLKEHCTINVTAKGINDLVQISWTPYIGANVENYSVYRMEIGSNTPIQIATVASDVLTVTDTTAYCPINYSYRVKANKLNENFISSSSDTSMTKTPYNILSQQKVDVVRSTVINNSQILTEWNTPTLASEKIIGYDIYKSTDNDKYLLLTNVTSQIHEYIDNDVDVNAKQYFYKIEAKNSCGGSSHSSNKSSSILLKAELSDGTIYLDWTGYEGWSMGVDYYIVEKMDEQGQWKTIKKVEGTQLNYQVE